MQDLAARFGVSILISLVAHPELNPIEMVWGTTTMALKRTNTTFSLVSLRALAEVEFAKITAEVWQRYEDHAIKVEGYYRSVEDISAEVEAAFSGDLEEDEAEEDFINGGSEDDEDGMSEKCD